MSCLLFKLANKLTIVAAVLIVLGGSALSASAQDARIQTSQLEALSSRASQTLNVDIDERLIQLAAKFLDNKDRKEAAAKDLVNGLKGVYVRSYEFDTENQFSQADVESIRSQLKGPLWTRMVGVKSRKEGALEVYLHVTANKVGGLAVLATNPKQLIVVNIVGPVDLEKLSQLEGEFGIPDLEIEYPKKTKNQE